MKQLLRSELKSKKLLNGDVKQPLSPKIEEAIEKGVVKYFSLMKDRSREYLESDSQVMEKTQVLNAISAVVHRQEAIKSNLAGDDCGGVHPDSQKECLSEVLNRQLEIEGSDLLP